MKEEKRISEIEKEIKNLLKEKDKLNIIIVMRDSLCLAVEDIDNRIKEYPEEDFIIRFKSGVNRFCLYSRLKYKEEVCFVFKYPDEKKAEKWLISSKYKDICKF